MPARKRIALVTQFYSPEPCAASNRLSALAATLAAAGNDVMVVTGFPSFPTGEIPPAYRRRFFVRENVGGIAVARVWTFASERKSRRNRFLNWLSVALGASLYLLLQRARFDVIVVSSPPITLALPALVGKVRHRATLVADIRDVFPDVAVRIGEWREDSTIVRLVAAVAESLYRAANVVVCVTETARDEIAARGVPLEKIAVRPNGFDEVVPSLPASFRRAGDEFVVAYVGNMGLATGLDVVVDAAQLLRDRRDVRFVMIGGGAEAERLGRRARDEGLRNLEFLGVLPRAEAFGVLAQADACVVPLKPALADSLPTKMFDAMAVGCPIVLSAGGEAARLLARASAGIAVEPGNARALADAIVELRDDAVRRRAFGEGGKRFVRAEYDRSQIMAGYATAIGTL